ncbi:MAG TPA: pyridoxamine 5'-phosphate oxidase [Bryobacteraceae bacterium]|jgi:pyridoxamine 5'-phosphate oxidase|nr:pyridoxamine 5'-phosphate oxidase [Bryobacteraceae bacterium]
MTPLEEMRKSYTLAGLREAEVDPDPITQFQRWFEEAVAANLVEANAMTLATASREGMPSARIVLLKGLSREGFVFYTNYESQKGRELEENPNAALVFYWGPLERQVRVSGRVARLSREESLAYFRSRPKGHQLGALASRQSTVVMDRAALERTLHDLERTYESSEVPLPDFWGGYRLKPESIEFWQGRPNRLHDRIRYLQRAGGSWAIERLSP